MSTKYLFSGLMLLSFNGLFAQDAQQVADLVYNKNFYLNMGQFFANTFQVGFEKALSNTNGLLISPRIMYRSDNDPEDYTIGGGGELQFRIYLMEGDKRIHFSPYFSYDYLEDRNTQYLYTSYPSYVYDTVKTVKIISTFATGVVFGIKVMSGKFAVDMYTGGGIRYSKINNNQSFSLGSAVYGPGYSGIMLKGGVQVGINF